MNIAIVTPLPITEPGGVEKVTLLLNNILQEEGHSVEIFDKTYFANKYKNVFDLKLLGQYKLSYDLGNLINSEEKRFDLVICNAMYGWRIRHKKVINISHGKAAAYADANKKVMSFISYYKTRYIDSFFEVLSASKHTTVVVSNGTGNEWERYHGIKDYVVIPNSIDTSKFIPRTDKKEWRRKFNLPENDCLGLFVGRPDYKKGIDIIRRVANSLDVSNKIVAAAPQSDLKTNNMISLGNINYKDMPYLYNACDYFILPSRYEACSMAVLEAMSSGVPIVVSKVGIASDIADKDKKIGDYVIDSFDYREYVARIRKINSSERGYSSELSMRVRDYAVREHSLDVFKRKYLALVDQIVGL